MNLEILQEDNEGMEGQLKSWWGKLTDSDLKVIKDKNEQLLEILQERYGWSKTHAKKEIRINLENYQHLQPENNKEGIMVHQPRPDKKNAQFSPSRQGVRADDSQSGNNRMDDRDQYDAQPSRQQYGRDDEHNQNQGHGQTGNYCSQCGSYIGKNSNAGRQNSGSGYDSPSSNRSGTSRNQNMYSQEHDENDEDNGQYATNQSGMQKKQSGSNINQKNTDQQGSKSVQSKAKR